MRCIRAVICSWLLLMSQQQVICYSEEDLAEALWSDTSNMLGRSEMNEICRFLLREGTSDIDPSSVDRINLNVYRSVYALLAYINEPAREAALLRGIEWRCRQLLQRDEQWMDMEDAAEPVHKRGETEKMVGKKVKFHSWGGKRTGDMSNDLIIPNPSYRAKFHAWGGRKRSVPEVGKPVASPRSSPSTRGQE